jgi:hypothetical protein
MSSFCVVWNSLFTWRLRNKSEWSDNGRVSRYSGHLLFDMCSILAGLPSIVVAVVRFHRAQQIVSEPLHYEDLAVSLPIDININILGKNTAIRRVIIVGINISMVMVSRAASHHQPGYRDIHLMQVDFV